MSSDRSTIEAAPPGSADGAAANGGGAPQGHAHRDRQPHRARATSCRSRTEPCAAMDLRQIKTDDEDFGLMVYDPAYMNTASCRSSITYIDGDAGILQHRGYPIEQLCEHSTYLEVAYLLINGAAAQRSRARGLGRRDHDPHVRARERQGLHAGLPLRRQPDGHARRLRRRAVDLLPRREQDPRRARPRDPDHPAAGEDADARRVRVPPQHGPALRLPRQRPRLRRATSSR